MRAWGRWTDVSNSCGRQARARARGRVGRRRSYLRQVLVPIGLVLVDGRGLQPLVELGVPPLQHPQQRLGQQPTQHDVTVFAQLPPCRGRVQVPSVERAPGELGCEVVLVDGGDGAAGGGDRRGRALAFALALGRGRLVNRGLVSQQAHARPRARHPPPRRRPPDAAVTEQGIGGGVAGGEARLEERAADRHVRRLRRRRLQLPERPQAVEAHQMRLPVMRLHACCLVERREREAVGALADADLGEEKVRVHVVRVHAHHLLQRARRVAHRAEEAPQPPV